jgi:flagellar assembly protein FliH
MEIILRTPILSATTLKIGRRAAPATSVSPVSSASLSNDKPLPVAPGETSLDVSQLRLKLQRELRAELEPNLRQELKQELRQELQLDSERQAEKSGYAEGLRKGKAEAQASLQAQAGRLLALATTLAETRSELIAATEDDLIELVFAAVTRIIGGQALSRECIVGMAQQAIAERDLHGKLTLLLHPQDHALIHAAIAASDNDADGEALPDGPQVDWKADRTVTLGGCVIETAAGTLDARLDTQLKLLSTHLLSVRMERPPSLETPSAPCPMDGSS